VPKKPPCGLTPAQYALYLSDATLQEVFPKLEFGDATHLSGNYNFAQWWQRMEMENPEVIKRANELVGNFENDDTHNPPMSCPSPQDPESASELIVVGKKLVEAINRLADAYEKLSASLEGDMHD